MVRFSFYNKNKNVIDSIDPRENLPDEVASMRVQGPFDNSTTSYNVFTTMLKSSPKKLEHVSMYELSAENPEFLSFLALICNKTKSLKVTDCSFSTNAATVLMTALLPRDGIRRLSLMGFYGPLNTTEQSKILFEGIASSLCLESFTLEASSFADDLTVGRLLIQALGRNQSLRDIHVSTDHFAFADPDLFLPKFLEASILRPNRKSVSIESDGGGLQMGVLENILCRKECSLEKLRIHGLRISIEDYWRQNGSVLQNKSVTSLTFADCSLPPEGRFAKKISLFKSLEELNLFGTRLSELSYLDPLLVGERSQLKSLDVRENAVDEVKMKKFINKLRNVRGLKHLYIKDVGWENPDSVTTTLNDVLRNNTDLEHVDCVGRDDLLLHLNRAGRRAFVPSLESFPTNLLPRVLERASKILYYGPTDNWSSPQDEKPRSDVVFWMVQRIAPHLEATAKANNQAARSSQEPESHILAKTRKRAIASITREIPKKKRVINAEEFD